MASKEPRRRRRGLVILVLALLAAAGAVAFRVLRRRSAEWPAVLDGPPAPTPPRPATAVPPAPVPQLEPPAPPPPAPVDTVAPVAPVAVATSDAGPAAAPDDLVVIDGIGPKIAAALAAGGVTTFAALADTSPERLRDLLAEHGLRFAPTLETWPAQARARLA